MHFIEKADDYLFTSKISNQISNGIYQVRFFLCNCNAFKVNFRIALPITCIFSIHWSYEKGWQKCTTSRAKYETKYYWLWQKIFHSLIVVSCIWNRNTIDHSVIISGVVYDRLTCFMLFHSFYFEFMSNAFTVLIYQIKTSYKLNNII